jgi:hypothetical protein
MSAMTGGTTKVPSWWTMNTKVKGIARGDVVFVFGERENHALKAQLILFAAPATTITRPTATPTIQTIPTTPPTTIAPAVAPTGNVPTVTGTHS